MTSQSNLAALVSALTVQLSALTTQLSKVQSEAFNVEREIGRPAGVSSAMAAGALARSATVTEIDGASSALNVGRLVKR